MPEEIKIPIEPGFYWAKSKEGYKWWNLILYVYGESPFLKVRAFDYADSDRIGFLVTDPESAIFGPRIDAPE